MQRPWILLIVASLLLSACAPQAAPTAAVPPPPSETPAPTTTPAPTETPTRTPTATPTPIPTLPPEQVGGLEGVPDPRYSNPELFDLNNPNAPIPQFVNAMRTAGIEVDPQEVANNLEFRQITGVDGERYVVASYMIVGESGRSYFMGYKAKREETENWLWQNIGIKDFCTNCGSTVDFSDPQSRSIDYERKVVANFSHITTTGAFMETYWQYRGGEYWSRFASRYNLPLFIHNVFFNFDSMPERGANEFISNRLSKILTTITDNSSSTLPFTLILAGEPYFYYQGQIIWHGKYDQFMLYRELGQNWIVEAEFELLSQIFHRQIDPQRIKVIGINLPGIETSNPVTEYTINYVIRLKQQVFERMNAEMKEYLGIRNWSDVPFDVGMEFHLGNRLGDRNVTLPIPINIDTILNNVKTITTQTGSQVHITELDGIGSEEQIAEAFASLIQSNTFSSITFFEPFKPIEGPEDPWQNILFDDQQLPTQWYYRLLYLLSAAL
jgi:hypothetical protein